MTLPETDIITFINDYIAENGTGPSVRTVAREFKYSEFATYTFLTEGFDDFEIRIERK